MSASRMLRKATPADAAALADLGKRAFVAKFGDMYKPEDLANFLVGAHTTEIINEEIANPDFRIMLSEEEGKLVGFCKMVMACAWPDYARGKKVIELKQLYTDPEITGRGIGTHLMDWAMETAHDWQADEMQLTVFSGNEGAQRFYARYGFTKVADIFFMVGEHRDDEFLYARMLSS